ncbi:MAG: NAD(P)H-dependent oxidoreductase subunit E [Lentisphaeria bacterium]|nr:NAD(P)H-dependent oxidoreductase subunit E [Lentisphaeria bacterium]NQZ70421.1 NAD(P)H-dependent oxidoreductase subunit E [Lentisphaeria bacterium]
MPENLSRLAGRQGLDNNLFEKMGVMARDSGTPSSDDVSALAHEFLVGDASAYGTISFYDFLKEDNKGKSVYVCSGSCCMLAGTQDNLIDEIKKHVPADEIGHMCCLGRCHENGAFNYNGLNYSAQSADQIEALFKGESSTSDTYITTAIGTPVLTSEFPGIDPYYELLSTVFEKGQDWALAEIKTSIIRGRGGAGFPMSFKLEGCRSSEGDEKYIVCNADEGDPGAYSDRYIMEEQPHSLLFGMIVAGFIVGASRGVVYIRAEYPESITIITQAIEDLREKKLLGDDILGSGFSYDFKVIGAQGAYICGEETAMLSSIEGQRPEVRVRPPYPTVEGLFSKPTVVNNVETLAGVYYILKEGGAAFANLGTVKSTGTKLVSLDGFFKTPGVYEVEMGTPLSQVVNELGGGFNASIKALHIGGPLGGLFPIDMIEKLNIDFESFSENGLLLGHASIVCIPEDYPLVKYLHHLFEFTSLESCGKCYPCRIGAKRGEELLDKAINKSQKIDRELFNDLLETMELGSLCALGGGIPLPVQNALKYFDDELKEYFEG